jgi:hypothetical protein
MAFFRGNINGTNYGTYMPPIDFCIHFDDGPKHVHLPSVIVGEWVGPLKPALNPDQHEPHGTNLEEMELGDYDKHVRRSLDRRNAYVNHGR